MTSFQDFETGGYSTKTVLGSGRRNGTMYWSGGGQLVTLVWPPGRQAAKITDRDFSFTVRSSMHIN